MIIRILQFFAVLFLCTNCSERPTSAEEIVEKSIQFHDPKNNWENFEGKLKFESRFHFNDSIPEILWLTFINGKNEFEYFNLDRAVHLKYNKDTCYKYSKNGSCIGYEWASRFYPFMWGLPMKIKDPGVTPQSDFKSTSINGVEVWVVEVHYESENFWYYFNKHNYALVALKFIKNDSSKKGEIVLLKELKKVFSMNLPTFRTYLNLDSSLIGTNQLLEFKPVEN